MVDIESPQGLSAGVGAVAAESNVPTAGGVMSTGSNDLAVNAAGDSSPETTDRGSSSPRPHSDKTAEPEPSTASSVEGKAAEVAVSARHSTGSTSAVSQAESAVGAVAFPRGRADLPPASSEKESALSTAAFNSNATPSVGAAAPSPVLTDSAAPPVSAKTSAADVSAQNSPADVGSKPLGVAGDRVPSRGEREGSPLSGGAQLGGGGSPLPARGLPPLVTVTAAGAQVVDLVTPPGPAGDGEQSFGFGHGSTASWPTCTPAKSSVNTPTSATPKSALPTLALLTPAQKATVGLGTAGSSPASTLPPPAQNATLCLGTSTNALTPATPTPAQNPPVDLGMSANVVDEKNAPSISNSGAQISEETGGAVGWGANMDDLQRALNLLSNAVKVGASVAGGCSKELEPVFLGLAQAINVAAQAESVEPTRLNKFRRDFDALRREMHGARAAKDPSVALVEGVVEEGGPKCVGICSSVQGPTHPAQGFGASGRGGGGNTGGSSSTGPPAATRELKCMQGYLETQYRDTTRVRSCLLLP